MAFNFPNTPTEGQIFTDTASGAQYVYRSAVWMQSSAAQINLGAQTRNRIVNSAMQISQEGGSGADGGVGRYVADQWYWSHNVNALNNQWAVFPSPNLSTNVLSASVGVATPSLAAGSIIQLYQPIEGNRVADFAYGTASAKPAVLRFWAQAPTGTYSIVINNGAGNRSFLAPWTSTAANIWQQYVIPVPGDVTGTWAKDTGIGMYVQVCLSAGSTYLGVAGWQAGNKLSLPGQTNFAATVGNVFNLADVGLYLDPSSTGAAPAWTAPDYAQELAACMRYYETLNGIAVQGYTVAGQALLETVMFKARKRVAPSATLTTWTVAVNCSGQAAYDPQTDGVQMLIIAVGTGTAYMQGIQAVASARM